ncbi:hypothetical protein VDG1235_459 [Verrucomicrobiia bacterium DG1235]|nr:hypothetical protein VDG1235_459 [Verrucomicrobiae bacterium DG1235]
MVATKTSKAASQSTKRLFVTQTNAEYNFPIPFNHGSIRQSEPLHEQI